MEVALWTRKPTDLKLPIQLQYKLLIFVKWRISELLNCDVQLFRALKTTTGVDHTGFSWAIETAPTLLKSAIVTNMRFI